MISNHSCGKISHVLGGFGLAVASISLTYSAIGPSIHQLDASAFAITTLALTILSIVACLAGSRLTRSKEA
ncbi:MAG: hypothetical protein K940chlam4_01345 [Candidatus Anoxychlamydiales bacterium]|nr:hypothetical protein [Candidatus Anoxychlamydiales bacterium]